MKKLDDNDREILRELVRNPRLSDNQISRKTQIPLKTVNRKRKAMEESGVLNYLVWVNNSPYGTGESCLPQLYIVKLRFGITRKQVTDALISQSFRDVDLKHQLLMAIGEYEGHVTIVTIYTSRTESDILEIFNAEFIPRIRQFFGPDSVDSTMVLHLSHPIVILHNYLPFINMQNGKIKNDWPNNLIFVSQN